MKILAALFYLFTNVTSATEKLKVGIFELPPHAIFKANNAQPSGAIPEFYKTYFEPDLGKAEWFELPLARAVMELKSGNVDIVFLLAKTSERLNFIKYSKEPFFSDDSVIITKKTSKVKKINSLKDIAGWTLGHTSLSLRPSYFNEHQIVLDQLSGENIFDRNVKKLIAGRIDGIYVPMRTNGEYLLKTTDKKNDLKILLLPVDKLNLYICFRKDISLKIEKQVNLLIEKNKEHYPALLNKY